MTKEKAEKILPVIQAIINGQKIQVNINNRWQDVDENHNCAFLPESYEYRIKPESKYRPFKDAKECMAEMLKHQPFGWTKYQCDFLQIIHVDDNSIGDGSTYGVILHSKFEDIFKNSTFADGTPFGIKEED